ncbi:MAG: hypothetical protein J5736_03435 [Bacilli bacterium]|nr:hypothetical protein [Bacilli bacterium]
MNKKFIKWQLGQWLPLIIVFGVFLAAVFLSTCLNSQIYAYAAESNGVRYIVEYPETNIASIIVPALLLTFIMPCFVFHFRYRRESADFFRQAPVKEAEIRRYKMVLGLLIILALVTVVFWLGFLLMILRFALAPQMPRSIGSLFFSYYYYDSYSQVAYNLYFGYYPLVWLLLLVFIVVQYSINCFLMSMTGTLLDGILFLLVGQIFLIGVFSFPILLATEIVSMATNDSGVVAVFTGLLRIFPNVGIVEPILFLESLFESLIQRNVVTILSENAGINVALFLSLALYLGLGGACGFFVWKGKDPSGEYFGKNGPRHRYSALPIFLAGAASAILLPIVSSVSAFGTWVGIVFFVTFFYTLWALGYFVILVIYNRSFRIGLRTLAVYLITIGACLVLVIAMAIYFNVMVTARLSEIPSEEPSILLLSLLP